MKFAAVSLRFYFVSQAFSGTVFRYLSGGKWGQDERYLANFPAEIAAFLLRNASETFEKLEHFLREIAADFRRNTEQKITPRLWNWLQNKGCSARHNHHENAEEAATSAMCYDCLQGGNR